MAASALDIATGVAGLLGRRRGAVVRAYDVVAATLAWPLALFLRQDLSFETGALDTLARDLVVVAGLAFVVFELSGVHRAFWRYATAADLASVALGVLMLASSTTLGRFLLDRLDSVPRSIPILFALVTLVLLVGARIGWMLVVGRPSAVASSPNAPVAAFRPVLLVGAGEGAALAIQLLRHAGGPAYRPVGILDEQATIGREVMGVPVLGRLADLGPTLARLEVRGLRPARILITGAGPSLPAAALRALRERAYAERLPVDHLFELARLSWSGAAGPEAATPAPDLPRRALAYAIAKRAVDTTIAGLALVLTSPLCLAIALVVAATLGRPVLFTQVRRGRAMVPFTLYKFRSLADVVDRDGRLLGDDQRQTRLGRFLRRTRLDELPQLWNVLRGDMALIGPRPLIEADLAALPDRGRERSRVRPGITGWAQVNGGAALGPAEKHALDLWYIRHASLALDARILLRTGRMMIVGEKVDPVEVRRAMADLAPVETPAEAAA